MKRRFFRMLTIALLTVLCVFGILAGCMIVQQDKMIYLPRTYTAAEHNHFKEEGLIALTFETSQGSQTTHWLPPAITTKETPPCWLVFSGNGGCAPDYLSVARSGPKGCGWLFVDYPSYGACDGNPNPETIRENAQGAIDSLSKHLSIPRETLVPKLSAFGHSIGAAAALDIGAQAGMKRIVVVSPFTSLKDMAARFITPLLTGFLYHRFDNRATLDQAVGNGATITILHGTADSIIPPSMGKALAERHAKATQFVPIERAGHNDIIDLGEKEIAAALARTR